MPPNSTFECSWFLPFPFRVFLMSENVPDEERLASIIDFGNQSVLVPGNVEYHIGPHPVCTPKNLLQLRKALPRAASRNAIPMVESGACVGTCRLELSSRLIPDDVHAPLIHVPITGTVSQPLSAIFTELLRSLQPLCSPGSGARTE